MIFRILKVVDHKNKENSKGEFSCVLEFTRIKIPLLSKFEFHFENKSKFELSLKNVQIFDRSIDHIPEGIRVVSTFKVLDNKEIPINEFFLDEDGYTEKELFIKLVEIEGSV